MSHAVHIAFQFAFLLGSCDRPGSRLAFKEREVSFINPLDKHFLSLHGVPGLFWAWGIQQGVPACG